MVYTSSESFGGFAGLREFLLRRIVRIVPMYWMAMFAFLAYILHIGQTWAQEGISDQGVLCQFPRRPDRQGNGPADRLSPSRALGQPLRRCAAEGGHERERDQSATIRAPCGGVVQGSAGPFIPH